MRLDARRLQDRSNINSNCFQNLLPFVCKNTYSMRIQDEEIMRCFYCENIGGENSLVQLPEREERHDRPAKRWERTRACWSAGHGVPSPRSSGWPGRGLPCSAVEPERWLRTFASIPGALGGAHQWGGSPESRGASRPRMRALESPRGRGRPPHFPHRVEQVMS